MREGRSGREKWRWEYYGRRGGRKRGYREERSRRRGVEDWIIREESILGGEEWGKKE